jgi:sterol desaturase/sphingolipid hydroxylase (fatty acid hydroxylase superfamily)
MKPDYTVILYSLPGFIILMIAESIELIRENRFGEGKKNMLSSVFIGLVAIIVSFTIKGIVLYCYTWVYSFRLFDLPKSAWVWVLCFFGDDFTFYWLHRASHHIRFLWASHSVHHSPQTFTLCTALCMPWTANITGNFLFWAWMPLIGISPAVIITMKSISALYQFWLHTERIKKMPRWFEALFNTPSHHRVHHSSEVEYLDKNHGAI